MKGLFVDDITASLKNDQIVPVERDQIIIKVHARPGIAMFDIARNFNAQ